MSALAARYPRLLLRSVGYEFRKRIQFRTGFFVREAINGTVEPLIMLFVFGALYASAPEGAEGAPAVLGGWRYDEIVRYCAGLMVVRKLVFNNRGLELASEIFEGRITKYLVMPFRFFVLVQGRFVQYLAMQVLVAGVVWAIGYAIVGDRWLVPVSAAAAAQAFTLVLLGSYCCFLLFFTINALAFWLDVVWSLLVMAWFVISFTGGAVLPVSQMPEPLFRVLSYAFPYWTITAPIELLMGRLGPDAFQRGLVLVLAQLVLLEGIRRAVWRRGLAKYVGAGM
ncbi:MAG: ABC-2 family transporter protein [Planctomycetota bacterium]